MSKTKQQILRESFDIQAEQLKTPHVTDEQFQSVVSDPEVWVPFNYCMQTYATQVVLADREAIITALNLTEEQELLLKTLEIKA